MAVENGSPRDDKLRLAFEDDDDDSSRTANRRVLFEETGRTKCTPARPLGTDPGRLRVNLGIQQGAVTIGLQEGRGAPGVLMKIGAAGMVRRKAAGRDKPKVKVHLASRWAEENKPKPSPADDKDSRHLEEAASPGHLDLSRRVKMLML